MAHPINDVLVLENLVNEEMVKHSNSYWNALSKGSKVKSLKKAYKGFDECNALRTEISRLRIETQMDVRKVR